MLPIENEHYGMLYTFQPNYLAQLISDDKDMVKPDSEFNGAEKGWWNAFARYVLAFLNK